MPVVMEDKFKFKSLLGTLPVATITGSLQTMPRPVKESAFQKPFSVITRIPGKAVLGSVN